MNPLLWFEFFVSIFWNIKTTSSLLNRAGPLQYVELFVKKLEISILKEGYQKANHDFHTF